MNAQKYGNIMRRLNHNLSVDEVNKLFGYIPEGLQSTLKGELLGFMINALGEARKDAIEEGIKIGKNQGGGEEVKKEECAEIEEISIPIPIDAINPKVRDAWIRWITAGEKMAKICNDPNSTPEEKEGARKFFGEYKKAEFERSGFDFNTSDGVTLYGKPIDVFPKEQSQDRRSKNQAKRNRKQRNKMKYTPAPKDEEMEELRKNFAKQFPGMKIDSAMKLPNELSTIELERDIVRASFNCLKSQAGMKRIDCLFRGTDGIVIPDPDLDFILRTIGETPGELLITGTFEDGRTKTGKHFLNVIIDENFSYEDFLKSLPDVA